MTRIFGCKSLTRVNPVQIITYSHSIIFNNKASQGCNGYHHGLSCYSNTSSTTMDRKKKHEASNPVWRPVSTQSTSHQLQRTSASASQVEDFSKNAQTTSGPPDLSVSTATHAQSEGSEALEVLDTVHLVNETQKHSVSMEVSASLIRFIKGKGGSTHKQIEEETGAKIIFPSSKKENSIVIEGDTIESIAKASHKIQGVLEEAVKSPNLDYSHFISLPLALHPVLVDKLMDFQNSILGTSDSKVDEQVFSDSEGDESDGTDKKDEQLDGKDAAKIKVENENEQVRVEMNKIPSVSYPPKAAKSSNLYDMGIEKSIFIKPKTFHLTVLMLKLWNNERITAAAEVLQRVSSKVLDALEGRPVSIRLKGLESMRGSLEKAQILYTPVEVIGGEERLLRACQIITDAYIEAGLVLEKDARQKLKLHGTVMNARHRKRKKKTKRSDSFDARSIVEQYGSEDWGEYIIREAHLSQRFEFDESGYYHCCASIPFPEK